MIDERLEIWQMPIEEVEESITVPFFSRFSAPDTKQRRTIWKRRDEDMLEKLLRIVDENGWIAGSYVTYLISSDKREYGDIDVFAHTQTSYLDIVDN